MSTTALIVEILIIGIQGAIWVGLIILSIFGHDWIRSALDLIKGWEPLLYVFFIGICYALGTFIDRMADCLFLLCDPSNILMRFDWIKRKSEVAHDARMKVFLREKRATDYFFNIRSRIRIVKATALNVFLVTVSTVVFLCARPEHTSWKIIVSIIAVGLFFTFAFLLVFGTFEVTYKMRLDQATIGSEDKKQRNKGVCP